MREREGGREEESLNFKVNREKSQYSIKEKGIRGVGSIIHGKRVSQ